MKLNIAEGFYLPLEAVTQSIAILAKRRAGKSYAARRFAEQFAKAGLQVVIVDPKGDWWGIRSAADGKSPGLPITILGGAHGDLPLEVHSGEVVAKLVVYECVSVLLDLSTFRKKEVAVFMSEFLESFYRLKAAEAYRSPVMLIVDEADAIAPQKPFHGEERMLGAIEDIVRRGGQRGIGCLSITQRSAVLNKNVLTQTQVLIAMRTIAPQDLKAMDEWIDVHGTVEQRKVLMASLPSLPIGDAWFWAPGWPSEEGIFRRVHILPIETFDSGATPKPGEKRIEPKNLADVDLETLRRQMHATIEQTKLNDPKELRRQLADALQENSEMARMLAEPKVSDEQLSAEFKRGATYERNRLLSLITPRLENVLTGLDSDAPIPWTPVHNSIPPGHFSDDLLKTYRDFQERVKQQEREIVGNVTRAMFSEPNGNLDRMRRAILTSLAQHPNGLTKRQIQLHAGYSASGKLSTAFADLSRSGYVVADGPNLRITAEGKAILGPVDRLPSGRELYIHLLNSNKLSTMEKEFLKQIAGTAGPVARGKILEQSGYSASGKASTAFARLVRYGYAVKDGSGLRLAKELT